MLERRQGLTDTTVVTKRSRLATYAQPYDVALCASTERGRVVARFSGGPRGRGSTYLF